MIPSAMRRASIAILVLATASASAEPPPPSILLVTIDTLRADHVGCYGRKGGVTPNLDALARDGVRFDEARSHVPLTLPSHATILTGLLPPHHGVRGNAPFRLAASVPTLASVLRAKGYATGAVVASVILDRVTGIGHGFDVYDDNQRVGDRGAFDYLERGASQIAVSAGAILPRLSPPFFLWVHMYDPHRPWIAPPSFRAAHPGQLYDAEIAFADAALGEIRRRAAEQSGGNLIVLVLSDHGESLGDHGENQHGYTLHRGVLRVPLVLAGPGIPKGRTVADPVGLMDVAPTLADLAGTSLGTTDGKSLRPLWSSASGSARPGLLAVPLWEETLHPLYDSGWAPLRGLLTARWHFVEAPRPELYDRAADPNDRVDIAKKRPDTLRALRKQLQDRMTALKDVPEPELPAVSDSPDDDERLSRLASLGYLARSVPKGAAARLDPKDALPGFLAVESAGELNDQGRGPEARALLEPFLEKDPDNPRLLHQMGRALAASGQTDAADKALRRAIAVDPRSDFLRFTLASVLRAKGDDGGAREQLNAILLANPRAVDASLELAAMATQAGDEAGAEKILRASYDAGARDPAQLDLLGRRALRRGKPDEAQRYFAEALDLYPDDPIALLESARAAIGKDEPQRAVEMLRRCSDGALAFECRMELARALLIASGDFAGARAALTAARAAAKDDRMRQEVDARRATIDALEKQRR